MCQIAYLIALASLVISHRVANGVERAGERARAIACLALALGCGLGGRGKGGRCVPAERRDRRLCPRVIQRCVACAWH
ncbi:hypothetical protein V8E52_005319 [Russula decolorans]